MYKKEPLDISRTSTALPRADQRRSICRRSSNLRLPVQESGCVRGRPREQAGKGSAWGGLLEVDRESEV